MPVQRVSRGFKDISLSFQVNPLSKDLIAIKNETAIARSIRNLVLTLQGERFFNPILGSRVSKLLFSNVDEVTASAIEDEITNTIENFEPRVENVAIQARPLPQINSFDITVIFDIVGQEFPTQEYSFLLEATR